MLREIEISISKDTTIWIVPDNVIDLRGNADALHVVVDTNYVIALATNDVVVFNPTEVIAFVTIEVIKRKYKHLVKIGQVFNTNNLTHLQ